MIAIQSNTLSSDRSREVCGRQLQLATSDEAVCQADSRGMSGLYDIDGNRQFRTFGSEVMTSCKAWSAICTNLTLDFDERWLCLQHRARGAKSTLFCCRERAPGVSPADQPARTLRGLGVGRRQLEGGSARGTLRHGQGTRE